MTAREILSIIAIYSWLATGLLIISSMYLGWDGWAINTVIGILFCCYSYYLSFRAKTINVLIDCQKASNNLDKGRDKALKRFIYVENILLTLHVLVGLLALSAVISRVFSEGFPVFG